MIAKRNTVLELKRKPPFKGPLLFGKTRFKARPNPKAITLEPMRGKVCPKNQAREAIIRDSKTPG
jgi:hypothetical protein